MEILDRHFIYGESTIGQGLQYRRFAAAFALGRRFMYDESKIDQGQQHRRFSPAFKRATCD